MISFSEFGLRMTASPNGVILQRAEQNHFPFLPKRGNFLVLCSGPPFVGF